MNEQDQKFYKHYYECIPILISALKKLKGGSDDSPRRLADKALYEWDRARGDIERSDTNINTHDVNCDRCNTELFSDKYNFSINHREDSGGGTKTHIMRLCSVCRDKSRQELSDLIKIINGA